MQDSKRTTYISFGLIIGSTIGLFLDIYQINIYGAIGLGIVYTPMIGLLLAVFIFSLFNKK